MNNSRVILHSREYTYNNDSKTRFGLVRVMRIPLHLENTVKLGMAIWVGLQIFPLGAGEALAQTQNIGKLDTELDTVGVLFNVVELDSNGRTSNSQHSTVRFSPLQNQSHKIPRSWQAFNGQKEFDSEDNGKPDSTRGTGTRCRDGNLLQDLLF